MSANTGSRSTKQTVSLPPSFPVRTHPALHWVQWLEANPGGVPQDGFCCVESMLFGLLCWLINSPSRAWALLVLGKPALQIVQRVVAKAQIIRRDFSRRKSPALPVVAALHPLARLRRGRVASCHASRRRPKTCDGCGSFLNPAASGVAPTGRSRIAPGVAPQGAKTGSGVLVAPAPVAPDDAGAFNQSRSRPPSRSLRLCKSSISCRMPSSPKWCNVI